MRRTFLLLVPLILLLLLWQQRGTTLPAQATETQAETQSPACLTQPKLTFLAHDVLPAVAPHE
jgi:hypothetical protein